jgi:hypothetical protein
MTLEKYTYRAGSLMLSGEEIQQAIEKGETVLLTFRKAYSIKENRNGFQIVEAYHHRGEMPLMRQGRFTFTTPKSANKLIGFELFLDGL